MTIESEKAHGDPMPPLRAQAWNLARSLADFVRDGLRTVGDSQYRKRLEICDACDRRRDNRCLDCGCLLSIKARGRAFACPKRKWPEVQENADKRGPEQG
jgi:hypothetical protein